MRLKGSVAAVLVVALGVAATLGHIGGSKATATTPSPTSTATATATVLPGPAGGKQLFAANCAVCHGDNAAGGYTMGGATSADLRWASLGPMYSNNVSLVTGAILNGKDQQGKDLDPVMPRWQGTLTTQQAVQIISYLQTLTTDAPANQPPAAPAGASPGEVLFYQNCTACHGTDAAGGKQVGPSATSADLRWSNLGPLYNNNVSLVTGAILTGTDQSGQSLDPAMPRWQGTLTSVQAGSVVAFLQTLGGAAPVSSPTAVPPPPTATPPAAAADAPTTSQVNVMENEWKLIPSPSSVHYGTVNFNVVNSGAKSHNLVIIKTNLAEGSLPMTADGKQVDEAAAGEVLGTITSSQLPAGGSATAAFSLTPGRYVLVCNVSNHYTNGMHAAFTVTQGGGVLGLPNSGTGTGGSPRPAWVEALALLALAAMGGGLALRRMTRN